MSSSGTHRASATRAWQCNGRPRPMPEACQPFDRIADVMALRQQTPRNSAGVQTHNACCGGDDPIRRCRHTCRSDTAGMESGFQLLKLSRWVRRTLRRKARHFRALPPSPGPRTRAGPSRTVESARQPSRRVRFDGGASVGPSGDVSRSRPAVREIESARTRLPARQTGVRLCVIRPSRGSSVTGHPDPTLPCPLHGPRMRSVRDVRALERAAARKRETPSVVRRPIRQCSVDVRFRCS